METLKYTREPKASDLFFIKVHTDDAAYDLPANEEVIIEPGERKLISTGISIQLPNNAMGMVCSRSGLALKHGVTVLNAPGIIDQNYRGIIGVILFNQGKESFVVKRKMRIAQLVIVDVKPTEALLVESLDNTDRGAKGFGSSGFILG